MKRIANSVALQTIGYVISGFEKVNIYIKEMGYKKQDIFRGLYSDFYMDGMKIYSHCKVTELVANNDELCVGISLHE